MMCHADSLRQHQRPSPGGSGESVLVAGPGRGPRCLYNPSGTAGSSGQPRPDHTGIETLPPGLVQPDLGDANLSQVDCVTQVFPVEWVGFDAFLGAEWEEIDVVDVGVIVSLLIKRRVQEEPLPLQTGIESSLGSRKTPRSSLGFYLPWRVRPRFPRSRRCLMVQGSPDRPPSSPPSEARWLRAAELRSPRR